MGLATLVLARCLAADGEVEALTIQHEQEMDVATSVGQPLQDAGDRHAAGTHSEKVANGACELAGILGEIEARKQRRSAEILCVSRMVKRLPVTQGRVIHLYYIKRLTLTAIARRMNFSYGYLRRVKADGLAALEKLPDEEVEAMLPPDYPKTLTEREVAGGRG
ncbi:MAG: hypothetical protein VB104_07855 [Candidatus Limiplasma sp.]|nr:hypothetical protein [Candidatus Limiplasma sp.]